MPHPTRNRKRRLEKWIRTRRTTRSSTSFGTCPKIRSKPEIRTSNNRKWKHDAEITTSFKSTRSTRRSRVSSTFSCETRSTFWNVKRSKKLGRDVILTTFLHFIKKALAFWNFCHKSYHSRWEERYFGSSSSSWSQFHINSVHSEVPKS